MEIYLHRFFIKDDNDSVAECLFSLAKWKRMVLADYGFECGEGLYTDMNAIRPDEECLDNLHSIYVEQWDCEHIINEQERNLDFLKVIVPRIYDVLRQNEQAVFKEHPTLEPVLPDAITFVHTEDLQARYLDKSRQEREDAITRESGAVFLVGIGGELADDTIHDGRAPGYDDWITPMGNVKRDSTAISCCGTPYWTGPLRLVPWAFAWTVTHCCNNSISEMSPSTANSPGINDY